MTSQIGWRVEYDTTIFVMLLRANFVQKNLASLMGFWGWLGSGLLLLDHPVRSCVCSRKTRRPTKWDRSAGILCLRPSVGRTSRPSIRAPTLERSVASSEPRSAAKSSPVLNVLTCCRVNVFGAFFCVGISVRKAQFLCEIISWHPVSL